VRFLLPISTSKGIYDDADLLFQARCAYLTAIAWKNDAKYSALRSEFEKPFQNALRTRFDRFAILRRWNYPSPDQCTFEVEQHKAQGPAEIASAVENKLQNDVFDPEDFEDLVLEFAQKGRLVGALLDELSEPPAAPTTDAIPFLGETVIADRLIGIAAKGSIALNVGGVWVARSSSHTGDDEANLYIRPKAYRTGQELRQIQLGLPSAVGGTAVAATPVGAVANALSPVMTSPVATPASQPAPTIKEASQGLALSTPAPVAAPVQPDVKPPSVRRTEEASTGVNLSGAFEKWGLPTHKQVTLARLEFQGLTVSQIKLLLTKIPSALKAILEVTYSEEDEA